ncbi:hypothetical protein EBB07_19420 [Paenibacillaceae bacterium]|nr:hypothetical protein EBB07_19420 [Paenibacillaceae bacterium]
MVKVKLKSPVLSEPKKTQSSLLVFAAIFPHSVNKILICFNRSSKSLAVCFLFNYKGT